VCKRVFCGILGISFGRLNYILKKKKNVPTGAPVSPDKRGKHTPHNKLSNFIHNKIDVFLAEFPKYKSHYSESNKVYFDSSYNTKKLYNIFIDINPGTKVSLQIFRKHVKKYNVGFYVPKKDTCAKCDNHKAEIENPSKTEDEKEEIRFIAHEHKQNATEARSKLQAATSLAKSHDNTLTFTFDLQKTLPMPYIPTSVAYYKRQMSFLNFGINTRQNNQGHMFSWTEVEGNRGSNEIISCISSFLDGIDLTKFKQIHSFSDCCPGQNRNKNLLSFMKYICQVTPIQTWRHTFLESGHSYLPNDTDFGKVEIMKKNTVALYNFDQYIDLLKRCNFKTTHMKGNFKDFTKLSTIFSLNKECNDSSKFKFLELRDFTISKHSKTINFSTSHLASQTESINFKNDDIESNFEIPNLYSNPIKLSKRRFEDLKAIFKYIPSIYVDEILKIPHEIEDTEENINYYEL
jgi:hypothetical protein